MSLLINCAPALATQTPPLSQTKESLATVYLNRGAQEALQGDYWSAIHEYNQALLLQPGNVNIYYNRGVAYYYTDQTTRALQDFDRAINLDPSFAPAYGDRGTIRLQMGDRRSARADFEEAARLFTQQGDHQSAQMMEAAVKSLTLSK